MASFEDRVNALTGLSIDASSTAPYRAQLTEFLKDAVIDVTNKSIGTNPVSAMEFMVDSGAKTSNGTDLNGN